MSTPADRIPPENPRRNLFRALGAAIRNRFAEVPDPISQGHIPTLPPVYAAPPASSRPAVADTLHGWNPDLPKHLQEQVESPFIQDTMARILGGVPTFGTGRHHGAMGFVDPRIPDRAYLNEVWRNFSDPARQQSTMAHEATHSAELLERDPDLKSLVNQLAPAYEKLGSLTKDPETADSTQFAASLDPREHLAYTVENALKAVREPDKYDLDELEKAMPGTRTVYEYIQGKLNPKPSSPIADEISQLEDRNPSASRDVTRFARKQEPTQERRVDTMAAAPDRGWFQNLTSGASEWMEENDVPDIREFPPIKLLLAVIGEHPGESVGGPGQAISAFARRSPAVMRRFADPGFHNWMIKKGPPQGYFSQIRDWAPEEVIDDLWSRYMATPEAKRSAARVTERASREAGAARGRRSTDAPERR